jgi:SAM-dependent methyltransferase
MNDVLLMQLMELPYFRAMLRAVEASYYQDLELLHPILDIGCGDGQFAKSTFASKLDVGIDPWRKSLLDAIQYGGYKLLTQGDGNCLPFPDKSFASAISNSVLEHIPDVESVLQEISRVLNNGARFIFCVPNDRYLHELSISRVLGKGYTDWFRHISRVFHADAPKVWQERLETAGFELEDRWNYFSPASMRMLEWGHYFGLPSLVVKYLTGRWILVPRKWNLALTRCIVKKYVSNDPIEDGVFTFYLARKKS